MKPITSFSMGLILGHIQYVLKNKPTKFTETSRIYLDEARDFFQKIIDNLDEFSDSRDNRSNVPVYNFVPNMKEMINIRISTEPSFKKAQLKETREFFISVVKMINDIKQNPRETYKRIDYEVMLSFFNSATALFQKNPMLYPDRQELHHTVIA